MKLGQIDGEGLIALLTLIIIVPVLIAIVNMATLSLRENQCEGYIAEISQLKARISSLENENSDLKSQLNISNTRYQELIKENVTKKDIVDIQTQITNNYNQIEILREEFITVNNNLINSYNLLVKNQVWSLTINFVVILFFAVDFALFTFFKFDVKRISIKIVKSISQTVISIFKKEK